MDTFLQARSLLRLWLRLTSQRDNCLHAKADLSRRSSLHAGADLPRRSSSHAGADLLRRSSSHAIAVLSRRRVPAGGNDFRSGVPFLADWCIMEARLPMGRTSKTTREYDA